MTQIVFTTTGPKVANEKDTGGRFYRVEEADYLMHEDKKAIQSLVNALRSMNNAWMCNVEWHDWESTVKEAVFLIDKFDSEF